MKILFFGDIVGRVGREAVKRLLPELKTEFAPDFTIANAENLAHGIGVTPATLNEMYEAGIDLFTSGNHVFAKNEVFLLLQEKEGRLLRPANYPVGVAGVGKKICTVGTKRLLVLNLMGRVFMKEHLDCPFRTIDELLADPSNSGVDASFIDFHSEATSEANAFGWYVDGRVSVCVGTHTHVPTADARLLTQGTAYISDVGMCGGKNTIIGAEKESIIKQFITQVPQKFEWPESGEAVVNAVLVEMNTPHSAQSILPIHREITIS